MTDPLVLTNRHTGETLRLRRIRERDGRVVLSIEGSLPEGSEGPPPHIHWQQDEEGSVVSGTLGATCGSQNLRASAGDRARFPAGVAHSWWNAGKGQLEFRGRAGPAGDLDRFLQGIFAVVNAGPSGKPPLFHLAHVLWRHRDGQCLARPPRFVQAFVFPVVVAAGRLLGKYRGTNWPGSPESCPGAPEAEA